MITVIKCVLPQWPVKSMSSATLKVSSVLLETGSGYFNIFSFMDVYQQAGEYGQIQL